jgi:hypothetical protein
MMALFHRGLADRRLRRSSHLSSVFVAAARVWAEVAESRGLEAVDDPTRRELRYAGAIRGIPCELALLDTGQGFVTVLRVEKAADVAGDVRVVAAAPLASIAQRLLGRRCATGDEAFDAAFLTTSTSAQAPAVLLDAEARAAILAVAHRLPELDLGRRGVALRMQGAELGHEVLRDLIDALVRAPTGAAMPYR